MNVSVRPIRVVKTNCVKCKISLTCGRTFPELKLYKVMKIRMSIKIDTLTITKVDHGLPSVAHSRTDMGPSAQLNRPGDDVLRDPLAGTPSLLKKAGTPSVGPWIRLVCLVRIRPDNLRGGTGEFLSPKWLATLLQHFRGGLHHLGVRFDLELKRLKAYSKDFLLN